MLRDALLVVRGTDFTIRRVMEERNLDVPYIVYEGEQARHERSVKRLIIALIISIIVIFLSNMAWLYAWNQFECIATDEDVTVDAKDGTANYIGNDGSIINNGEDSSKAEN